MPGLELAEDLLRLTVLENPYIPIGPFLRQQLFLVSQEDEVLYGGAAGGGKSMAVLAAALQYVMCPDYHALLLRRSFPDLNKPKALIPLSFEWLSDTDAEWLGSEKRWAFPSGATLSFGHMNNEKDKYGYQGSAYNFIGFDELTQFTLTMYTYLFSRLRRGAETRIPGRMRATSNPGGEGHDWVKERFLSVAPETTLQVLDEETKEHFSRVFIPAKLEDNPGLDQKDYLRKLGMLDPFTRAQLRRGDWDIRPAGNMFKRAWFKIVDGIPPEIINTLRVWDFAATPPTDDNPDPDWTCGLKMARTKGNRFILLDARRMRGDPGQNRDMVEQTASEDGRDVSIRIEIEPGASGKTVVYNFANQVLPSYDVRGIPASGEKVVRARPFSAACARGDVCLLRGPWNSWWLDNVTGFPGLTHDDPVDAAAHAYNALTEDLTIGDPAGDVRGYAT